MARFVLLALAACGGRADLPAEVDPTDEPAGPCAALGFETKPFDASADGVTYGETVKDLSWSTLSDRFTLSEHWTGCDAVVLLPVNQEFLPEDLGPMFTDADPNTVFLFFSATSERADATDDVTAWRQEVRSVLRELPAEERQAWNARIHYITAGTDNADLGAIVSGLQASDLAGIDQYQRLRRGGSLAVSTGNGWLPIAAHARYTAKGYNYEARLDERLAREERELGDGLSVITVIDGAYAEGTFTVGEQDGVVELDLPSAGELARFDRMEVVVRERCATSDFPHQAEGCSGEAGFSVHACRDDCSEQDVTQPFFRAISGYATGGTWTTDATAALPWLKRGGVQHVKIDGRATDTEGWRLGVELRLYDETDTEPSPSAAINLDGWTGINLRAAYSELTQVYEVEAPPGATQAELVYMATSHGGGGSGGCAEFCDIESTVLVNGEPFEHVWEMKDEWDCAARVDQGVTPNQWGTWYFDRASWCPGFTAEMWKADLTRAFDFDGPNRLALQGTQSRAFPTTGGFPSTVWLLFRGGELADPVLRPVPRASCSNVDVRVRDFDDAFEDFLPLLARFDGLDADDPERTGAAGIVPGAVSGLLVDGVPALVWPEGTLPFTTADRFDQWFRDVDGVNMAVDVSDRVVQTHVDTAMVRGSATSPHTVAPIIDDAFGFGPDATGRNGTKTVTVTADFVHRPGVTLRFGSHDDMWVYVDGQLALDRGGFDGSLFSSSGPSRTDLLDLDTLDLTEGETYTLKAFLVDRSDNGSWQWWAEVPDCLP